MIQQSPNNETFPLFHFQATDGPSDFEPRNPIDHDAADITDLGKDAKIDTIRPGNGRNKIETHTERLELNAKSICRSDNDRKFTARQKTTGAAIFNDQPGLRKYLADIFVLKHSVQRRQRICATGISKDPRSSWEIKVYVTRRANCTPRLDKSKGLAANKRVTTEMLAA